jgi:hypothetical protein
MKIVETGLESDGQVDEQAGGYADCQSGNIDKSVSPVASQIPESDFKIASYHGIRYSAQFKEN